MQDGRKTPKSYIRTIAELDDFMNEALAKQKVTPKKMNATQARGLNAVKQKIKKTSKEYQTEIDAYRADKDGFMESDDEEPEPVAKPKKVVKLEDDVAPAEELADDGFATVGKGGRTLQYTPESIFKHLRGIMESRGKKNTDRLEQIKVMEKLSEIANTPYQQIRVLLAIVSARFDLSAGTSNVMPLEHWKAAEKELSLLLTVLGKNEDYVVVENVEEWDDDEKPPSLQPGEKYIKVAGSVVSYVERLDDELVRSLQSIDPHTSEYIERLQDEGSLYNIVFRTQLYYERLRVDETLEIPQDSVNRIVMRRLEHVYFKVRILLPLKGKKKKKMMMKRTKKKKKKALIYGSSLYANHSRSPLKSSKRWRITAQKLSRRRRTRSSLPAASLRMPTAWSIFSATTCSAIATALSARVPCCPRFTSSLSTATTTRLVT